MAAQGSKSRHAVLVFIALLYLTCCFHHIKCAALHDGEGLSLSEATRKAFCNDPNDAAINSWTGDCVSELFAKYGSSDGRLKSEGFKQLIANVGLGFLHDMAGDTQTGGMNKSDGHAHTISDLTGNGDNSDSAKNIGYARARASSGQDIVSNGNAEHGRASRGAGEGGEGGGNSTTEGGAGINGTFHDTRHPDHHFNEHHATECLTPDEILGTLSIITAEGISPFQFLQLCPILVQQLDSQVCVVYDVHPPGDGHNHTEDTTPTSTKEGLPSKLRQGQLWGYSIGAITMISVASVTCIMMVPCIQRFPLAYGRLLSFLVAMAVGTLSGDSILHLIPHALGIHGHQEEAPPSASSSSSHQPHPTASASGGDSDPHLVVWRGCVILLGIFSFFIFEQTMRMCQNRPKKRLCSHESKQSLSSEGNKDVMGSQEIGERLCNHNETAHELIPMMHQQSPQEVKPVNERYSGVFSFKHKGRSSSIPHTELNDADRLDEEKRDTQRHSSLDLSVNKELETSYGGVSSSICKDPNLFRVSTPKKTNDASGCSSQVADDSPHDHNYHQHHHDHDHHHHHHHHHHGHSHAKGHSHGGSMGISAIAWMVVMGDGVHNFTDGLVVGAAFADSLAGGLSTAIAVMCHEIPHELGDFAVMLRGGMSIKQALGFQAVSSVLAYIGMAIGICIGHLSSVSLWVFALAGGAFLYIALTDLFPEMVESMNSTTDSKSCHLLLQVLGALFGIGTMLAIALYEERLIAALSS